MTTVLISGANKGIGYGFVEKYLARPNTTVIATVRDPESAKSLHDISKADGSNVVLVKVESVSETDAIEAVKSLRSQGINHLDVVIANAGVFHHHAFIEVSKMKATDLLEHVDVNAAGPVRLFQATLPLLQAAKQPKFIVISSFAGTISNAERINFPLSSYAASKAAVNFLLRRIHIEHPDLIAVSVHPGVVSTDAGVAVQKLFDMGPDITSVKDSVDGIVAEIDKATREGTAGKFLSYDGTELPW